MAINGRKYDVACAYAADGSRIVDSMYATAQNTVHIGMEMLLIRIIIASTSPEALRRKILLFVLRITGTMCQRKQLRAKSVFTGMEQTNSCHIVAKFLLTSALTCSPTHSIVQSLSN